jgi:predicted O-linked N-acetylglucosamine transferase (SPINDLY family)
MTGELLATGLRLHPAGDLARAEPTCRQVVQQEPTNAQGWQLLGLTLVKQGRLADALGALREAVRLQPEHVGALLYLGHTWRALRRTAEAVASYCAVLRLRPDLAEAYTQLAMALVEQQRLPEARDCFQRAVQLQPNSADAHANLGTTLCHLNEFEEAITSLRDAVRLRPDFAAAFYNLGNALRAQRHFDEALASVREAVRLQPGWPEAILSLANLLADRRRFDDAIPHYEAALRLKPDYAEAHGNLGHVHKEQVRLEDAIAACRTALRIKPDYAEARRSLANTLASQGQRDEAIAIFREALRLKSGSAADHSNLISYLNYHPDYDAASIHEEAHRWDQQHAESLRKLIQAHANRPDHGRRLRLGYVFPNFCSQAETFFTVPLLSAHNHQDFEVVCYADVLRPDEYTRRLQSHVWCGTLTLTDEQLADLARRDQIDILVDLTPHMTDKRLLAFAREPAPVQTCWLAYQGTTGLSTMDCRLTDRYCDPPGLFDRFYSEESIRLPDAFGCCRPLCSEPAVKPLPALEKGFVTFGSLNNFWKINASTLKLWARVLGVVEHARLLLVASEGSHRQGVLKLFAQEGVAPERVTFVAGRPRPQYLELCHQIDIGLDTVPYNAQTTTPDALWMGVPVLTLVGRTAVGRAALSLLQNLGLPEWVAETLEQFVALAAKLAADLHGLVAIRAGLRGRLQASPLMDGPRFARNVEAAYRRMWQAWCAKLQCGPSATTCRLHT